MMITRAVEQRKQLWRFRDGRGMSSVQEPGGLSSGPDLPLPCCMSLGRMFCLSFCFYLVCGSIGQGIHECILNALQHCRKAQNRTQRSFFLNAQPRGNHQRWCGVQPFQSSVYTGYLYKQRCTCVTCFFSLSRMRSHSIDSYEFCFFSLNSLIIIF